MSSIDPRRVSVREFRAADLESIVRLGDDREVWRALRDRFPRPYTIDDARDWLDFVASQNPVTHFAIEVDGAFAGGIGYSRRGDVERLAAEIGYWLGRPYWGRGIATAALATLVPRIFETTDLVRLDALVFATNPASSRVLEKCGFAFEGTLRRAIVKDGEILDARLYAILRTS